MYEGGLSLVTAWSKSISFFCKCCSNFDYKGIKVIYNFWYSLKVTDDCYFERLMVNGRLVRYDIRKFKNIRDLNKEDSRRKETEKSNKIIYMRRFSLKNEDQFCAVS